MNLSTSGAELMTRWNWDCINREVGMGLGQVSPEWLLSDLLSHAGVYVFPRTTFHGVLGDEASKSLI
ncbi:hypothetical protein F2Q69_00055635 [Brassica cretica]|uniref:Uncharacterized protein n=1 Tax=Brassica cretica TaxID=69181 RepID=A0A8S9N1A4_BRACR|nr:hypothetical protein F2Q69_00055635 [Brassica cretica]